MIHARFQANVDGERVLSLTGGCLIAPQIVHWGDNAENVQGPVESIKDMLKEALQRGSDGYPSCLPKPATMEQQMIPKEYRTRRSLNVILSREFTCILVAIIGALGFALFFFQGTIVQHPYFDQLEGRT